MKNNLSQSQFYEKFSAFEPYLNAVAIFIMATLFLFWDASRAVYVLLSLGAVGLHIKYRPQLPREHRLYSWPIFGFVGAAVLSMLASENPQSGVNVVTSRYLLLLLAVPLVSLFYLSFDAKRNSWIKFAVGCVVMGGLALNDILLLAEYRADGGHNAAAFGFLALAMTSVVLGSYHRFSQARFGRAVFFLAIAMGVCAMILSGTRSGWIAGFVVFFIASFFYFERYSVARRALFALGLFLAIAIVSSSIPVVQDRFEEMVDNFTPYLKGEQQTEYTSLRFRVEAWKFAWHVGMENKVFGFGPGNTKRAMKDFAEANQQVIALRELNHIHNQFLQSFAMTGLVGLFSLLAMIACHFWMFARYLGKKYSQEVRFLALSGLLLLVSYLLMCIPGVPFYGKQYLLMYGFASASIWGCLLGALRESRQTDQG